VVSAFLGPTFPIHGGECPHGFGSSNDDGMFKNRFSLSKSASCTSQSRNKLLICLQNALIPFIGTPGTLRE
jgi:hypothetical protein